MKAEEKKEEVEVEVGIEMKAMEALGKGFDLTSDFRLKFAKGTQRLVVGDEFNKRDILIPAGPTIPAFLSIFVVIKGLEIRGHFWMGFYVQLINFDSRSDDYFLGG